MLKFVKMTVAGAAMTLAGAGAMAAPQDAIKEINLYSSSKEHLIRPLLEHFEKQSGIKVNLTTLGGSELVSRLRLEGKDSPADAVMIADVARLSELQRLDLLAPLKSDIVEKAVAPELRAPDSSWTGIATRARLIFRRTDDAEAQVNDYRELADEKWRGAILIRSSSNEYNQSLMADMLYRFGKDEAQAWAKGVAANMARKPAGGDRDQLRALASGEGRLAVSNSYYYAMMLSGDDAGDKELAQKLVPMFAEQTPKGGTHVNIRGVGMTKYSERPAEVKRFVEYLVSDEAQRMLSEANQEYPVNPDVPASELLQSWQMIPEAQVPLSEIGSRNADTIELFSRAGWN